MAAMGKRKLKPKTSAVDLVVDHGITLTVPKLAQRGIVVMTTILDVNSPITGGLSSTLGIPIMRDGFVTDTRLQPSSSLAALLESTTLRLG
jgi:hypothetical protein